MRLILTLLCLTAFGCDVLSKSVPGSGVIKREARDVGDFTQLSFGGAADITVETGAEQTSCEVQCDDNLLQYISTDVVDGQLKIRTNNTSGISPSKRTQIRIAVPSLTKLDLAGGTTTSVTGLSQPAFDVQLAGGHDVSCQGQADVVHFKAAGSTKIQASELKTKSSSIELAGSGTADIQASDTLSVEIAGSGTVRYLGEPTVKQSIAGVGKVERLAEKISGPE